MKKIVFISPKFNEHIGGMESHAYEFAKYFLNDSEYRIVKVITKKNIDDGIKVDNTGSDPFKGLKISPLLTGDLKVDESIIFDNVLLDGGDVLFLNSPNWVPALNLFREKNPKVRIIVRSGGNDLAAGWIGSETTNKISIPDSQKILSNALNKNVDFLLLNSEYSRSLAYKINVNSELLKKFKGGVDTKRFVSGTDIHSPYKIITFCRLVDFKGLSESIWVIKKLVERGINVTFEIFGEGPEKQALMDQVNSFSLENHVFFRGSYSYEDISSVLKGKFLFLHMACHQVRQSSRGNYIHTETMGRSLCEAAALGLPVVATNVGGIPEVVIDQKTGFIVPEHDINSAVKRIQQLVNDPDLFTSMSEYSRSIAVNEFDWKLIFNAYKTLFAQK